MGENRETESRRAALARICRAFHVATLYVFGSQAGEALAWVEGERQTVEAVLNDIFTILL
jgi:hypothetical protein